MTITELEKEICEKELAAQKVKDDMFPIQIQLTQYITEGKRDKEEWYGKASVAYQVKKRRLRKLHHDISKLHSQRKALIQAQHRTTDRIQNHLFYNKLKELLSEEEMKEFMEYCAIVIEAELSEG